MLNLEAQAAELEKVTEPEKTPSVVEEQTQVEDQHQAE
jgi:hypothetical protein